MRIAHPILPPMALDDLPDDARLRVIPAHPALAEEPAAALAAAIGKLLAQWRREGAILDGACAVERGGALVLVAWREPGEPLSGCRKDMLAKTLALHERRSGCALLAPPPIVLARDGAPRCHTQRELRELVLSGAVDAATPAWDTLAETLGAWRAGQPRPVAAIPWLDAAVARLRARAAG